MKVNVKFLDNKAVLPRRAHDTDSGYDLTLIGVDKIIGDVIFFKTGLAVQSPPGYYFQIVPRSSISKLPLELANSVGILDEHYRGEILVAIRVTHQLMGQEQQNTHFPSGIIKFLGSRPTNLQSVAQMILKKKPVLAQMILRKRYECEFERVAELDDTDRGTGGFGSTDDLLAAFLPSKLEEE